MPSILEKLPETYIEYRLIYGIMGYDIAEVIMSINKNVPLKGESLHAISHRAGSTPRDALKNYIRKTISSYELEDYTADEYLGPSVNIILRAKSLKGLYLDNPEFFI